MMRYVRLLDFPNEPCYSLRYSDSTLNPSEKAKPFFINLHNHRIVSFTDRPTEPIFFDFSDRILIPRFVNAHAHLELSGFVKPVPWNGSFPSWIGNVMKHRCSDDYSLKSAIDIGEKELHESGTGLIYDILQSQDTFLRSEKTWRFLELIAWTDEQSEEKLNFAENFLKQNRYVGLSPHAPYTICPHLLQGAVRLSKMYKVPLAIHLAETEDEIQLLHDHTGPLLEMMRWADPDYQPEQTLLGNRPLHYLECLAESKQCLVIHGNYLDDEELRFVAAHENMTIVFCPAAYQYFGHTGYPLRKMLDLKIPVALGTDSRASWPSGPLSMIEVLNTLLAQFPDIKKTEALLMATTNGYLATGLHEPILEIDASLDGFIVI